MSDCCVQGIKPCECKGKGCQWFGNRVFRLGSRKEKKESEISGRDLQKPFEEFKTVNSILLTKYCSHHTEISTKDIVTVRPSPMKNVYSLGCSEDGQRGVDADDERPLPVAMRVEVPDGDNLGC